MAAAEGEDDFDPFPLQHFGDEPAAVDHAHGELPSLFVIDEFRKAVMFFNTA